MANFAVNTEMAGSQQNMSSTYKTQIATYALGSTVKRGKLYDLLIGTNGTPADNELEWDIVRMTATATLTATAATANALDPADSAAINTNGVNATAEPAITAASQIFYIGLNQRASYRWIAAPGSELVYPATASSGLLLRCKSAAYTSTVSAAILYQEQ